MPKKGGTKTPAFTDEQVASIQEQICLLAEPLLEPGVFLVDVALEQESNHWYLRLYLERKEFDISLSDCEAASRVLDSAIEGFFERQPETKEFRYILEVSSPGLFRELKTVRELGYYQGRSILVKNRKTKASFEGTLESYNAETQMLTVRKADTQQEESTETIPYPDKAWLVSLNHHIVFPE